MHKKPSLILLLLIIILIFSSCVKEEIILEDRTFALDTLIEIKIYQYSDGSTNETVIGESFELIRSLENTLSVHIEGSDIYNLKRSAGKQPTVVNQITYSILKDSIKYSELTNGLFDITAGPLIDLWAIDPPYGHVPSESELDTVLPLIDYNKISFLEDNQIILEEEGMIVNLGAIAKGTIADEVKKYLVENGVENAMINLGGNILLIGSKLNRSGFNIGIQDPNNDRGSYLMSVSISDSALVSSGDYERFFEYEGKEYHHILNPMTGYPAQTNIKQVTIVADSSQIADGFSTSVLLLGLKDGIELIESTPNVEAIFITKDSNIYITEGLRDSYELQPSLMQNYTIVDSSQDLY